MGDRNVIQLKKGGHWHYWNYGSMMPICGDGQPEHELYKKTPHEFVRSMTHNAMGYGKLKNFCPVCVAKEIPA